MLVRHRLVWVLLCCVFHYAWSAADEKPQAVERGAGIFSNWCAGCHALKYARAPFAGFNTVSLPREDANLWFGKQPPDLSLIVTVRGKVWLTDYLQGFYHEATQPFGTNNRIIPGVMMPNPFAAMPDPSPTVVDDLVSFLDYIADPTAHERYRVGRAVLLFLFLFWVVVYTLQRLVWKKIVRHI